MRRLAALLLSLFASAAPALAQESGWAKTLKSRARLVDAGVIAGARFAAIEIALDPGAVTYWRHPGESGVPPEIDTAGSRNLAAADLSFPAPGRFDKGGVATFGYDAAVTLPLRLTPVDPAAPVELKLRLDYGVCEVICVPARAEFALVLPPALARTAHSAAVGTALAKTPRPVAIGAAGALAILSVERDGAAEGPPTWRATTRGTGADLFVEAPPGWWFDVDGPFPDVEGRPVFRLRLAEKPKGRVDDPELRLTLATRAGGIETTIRLDRAGLAP
jgi:DsbC/DsbD-like thiol-disulfide interchange protein